MATARATDQSVQLRVFVDKESNKVLYAEAGKDFVDVLFSFFTLPLGTIVRLLSKESNIEAVKVGSLSSLYQSLADLDDQYLQTPIFKEMLLQPKNSMEDYCSKMKLNIDDTEPLQYFRCPTWECNRSEYGTRISTFRNYKCFCGKVMDTKVYPGSTNLQSGFVNQTLERTNLQNGFVIETATFIISDDLHVMPNDLRTIVSLLQKLGVNNTDSVQEQTVDITKKEVVDLLKLSFVSKTPLTNLVFKKNEFITNSNPIFGIGNVVSSNDNLRVMDLKVMVRKSNGEILFAQAKEDFVDFLLSFLTFPLGGALHMLEGFSSLDCFNNLYESMKELSPGRYLISQDHKDKLAKPQIAPQFNLTNQILPIGALSLPVNFCYTYSYNDTHDACLTKFRVYPENYVYNKHTSGKCVQFSFVNPKSSPSKSSSSKSSSSGEFAKGPSTFVVTDDLVVTPISSASAMSYLYRSKVPLLDLEEKIIKIGRREGLAILKASLISATALTDGLSQFITTVNDSAKRRRTVKEEK